MNNLATIRDRYQKDDLPTRLGGLAANLARVSSFSKNSANNDAVYGLLEESKYFIEWSAAEAETDVAVQLIELQVQLARWQCNWTSIWSDAARREDFIRQVRRWSDRILEASGVLDD
jgi:hypothetical protein